MAVGRLESNSNKNIITPPPLEVTCLKYFKLVTEEIKVEIPGYLGNGSGNTNSMAHSRAVLRRNLSFDAFIT